MLKINEPTRYPKLVPPPHILSAQSAGQYNPTKGQSCLFAQKCQCEKKNVDDTKIVIKHVDICPPPIDNFPKWLTLKKKYF